MKTQTADSSEHLRGYSSFEPDREERLRDGQVIVHGRYRIVRMLGRGGVAIAYEAVDTASQQNVAIKVVTSKHAGKQETVARYHSEARLAGAVGRHTNIVHPLEVGRVPEFHGRLYLAMELVRGRSLGKIMLHCTRGMEVERACRLGHDVARALKALHKRGIVHRDIKPDNIMVELHDGHDVAKVLDFGYAYALGDAKVEASADLTQVHERPGTAIYMAPEQAVGLRPTLAFDLYAFGATLYELLTGTAPYAHGGTSEVIQRKCDRNDPPPGVELLRDGIPDALASLTNSCLAWEPDKRPSIEEVLVVLEELSLAAKQSGKPQLTKADEGQASVRTTIVAPHQPPAGQADNQDIVAAPYHATEHTAPSPTAQTSCNAAVTRQHEKTEVAISTTSSSPAPNATSATRINRHFRLVAAAIALGSTVLVAWMWPRRAPEPAPDRDEVFASTVTEPADDPHQSPEEHPQPEPVSEPSPKPLAAASPTTSPPTPPLAPKVEPSPPEPRAMPLPSPPRPKPAKSAVDCPSIRTEANDAFAARSWAEVYRLTAARHRRCWKSDAERFRILRVTAALKTQHYSECARIASGSNSPELQRKHKICSAKAPE